MPIQRSCPFPIGFLCAAAAAHQAAGVCRVGDLRAFEQAGTLAFASREGGRHAPLSELDSVSRLGPFATDEANQQRSGRPAAASVAEVCGINALPTDTGAPLDRPVASGGGAIGDV
jgi:hypothetical protein